MSPLTPLPATPRPHQVYALPGLPGAVITVRPDGLGLVRFRHHTFRVDGAAVTVCQRAYPLGSDDLRRALLHVRVPHFAVLDDRDFRLFLPSAVAPDEQVWGLITAHHGEGRGAAHLTCGDQSTPCTWTQTEPDGDTWYEQAGRRARGGDTVGLTALIQAAS